VSAAPNGPRSNLAPPVGETPAAHPQLPTACGSPDCSSGSSVDVLNQSCYCVTVDKMTLRKSLDSEFGGIFSTAMWDSHEHLFATSPLFVGRTSLERMHSVVASVEEVVQTALFQEAAMKWAPEIARFDPGSHGGVLSYDFHLATSGPRLIEINTNPGGAFLNAVLGRFQKLCCNEEEGFATAPIGVVTESSLLDTFLADWRTQRGGAPLRVVAIVDESPAQQYLYPEFLLVAELLRRRGINAIVCDPSELVDRGGRVYHGDVPVDLVYNRLTDFSFARPEHGAIRAAYLARAIVLSPHPRAHALYADKRNLTLLCDPAFVRRCGVSEVVVGVLQQAVPPTEIVTVENRERLWSRRRDLFFKPATGYGSRATYRGDKITKRVWDEISHSPYVAQETVAPSQRHLGPSSDQALKVDVRVYAYAGEVKLVAARMYQGQTTNMRTPGGGFAAVLTHAS
jgi:hypothetical protein